jgi:hypothetical protein
MIKMEGMAPLNLVKEEVVVTLKQVEKHLRLYLEDCEEVEPLREAQTLLHQLRGILKLINLAGAVVLVSDLESSVTIVLEDIGNDQYDDLLTSIGQALLVLSHYIEFIHVRQNGIPVLLVPTINDLRRHLGTTLVSEFDFSEVDIPMNQLEETPTVDSAESVELDEIPIRSRRLRHMFQVGLLGVVRDENPQVNLRMMVRAIERLAQLTGDVPLAQLWWVSLAVLEVFLIGGVQLTSARKVVLSKIDRQIKRLVYEGAGYLNELMPLDLLRECLYLITLSNEDGQYTQDVKESFALEGIGFSDGKIIAERELMNGPGGTVIATVATNMREEMVAVKELLDSGARGTIVNQTSLQDLADTLTNVSSTMVMLGLIEASTMLREQVQEIRIWMARTQPLTEEAYWKLADVVLYSEQALSVLMMKHSGNKAAKHAQEPKNWSEDGELPNEVALSLLEEAHGVVVTEVRVALSQSKKQLTLYMDSDRDRSYAQNVPAILHDAMGALMFLHLERAANVIVGCKAYIQKHIVYASPDEKPTDFDLDTLADAISSIDYYLEGMEEHKPIGVGILEVAEESIQELGFLPSKVA